MNIEVEILELLSKSNHSFDELAEKEGFTLFSTKLDDRERNLWTAKLLNAIGFLLTHYCIKAKARFGSHSEDVMEYQITPAGEEQLDQFYRDQIFLGE